MENGDNETRDCIALWSDKMVLFVDRCFSLGERGVRFNIRVKKFKHLKLRENRIVTCPRFFNQTSLTSWSSLKPYRLNPSSFHLFLPSVSFEPRRSLHLLYQATIRQEAW